MQVTWDHSRTDLRLGTRRYRHAPFVVTPTPGAATIQGVLQLRLADEYLDQVREVPWAWPEAALEAQAAAARSYAVRKLQAGVRPECACHVVDGVGDQVYGPVPEGSEASFWPRWQTAVRAAAARRPVSSPGTAGNSSRRSTRPPPEAAPSTTRTPSPARRPCPTGAR